jgi:hypothetical protein
MKNRINNKLLAVTFLGAVLLSGCNSKTITIENNRVNSMSLPPINEVDMQQAKVSGWNKKKRRTEEDCPSCYATNIGKTPVRVATVEHVAVTTDIKSLPNVVYGYDYENNKIVEDSYALNDVETEEYDVQPYIEEEPQEVSIEEGNTYLVDASYSEDGYSKAVSRRVLPKRENRVSFSKDSAKIAKNSIQVGAFRKYAGAKVYAKRYSLLTSKYNVEIKENVKDRKPIYRVQIEGFSNENEAKNFMERYGLNGAFLVRR